MGQAANSNDEAFTPKDATLFFKGMFFLVIFFASVCLIALCCFSYLNKSAEERVRQERILHDQERTAFLASPYALGQAVGACWTIGQLNDPGNHASMEWMATSYNTVGSIIILDAFKPLVAKDPQAYVRGVDFGKVIDHTTSGDSEYTPAGQVCATGRQYLVEWGQAAFRENYSKAVKQREETQMMAPVTSVPASPKL